MRKKLYITTTLLLASCFAASAQKDSNYIVSLSVNTGIGIPLNGFESVQFNPDPTYTDAWPNLALPGFASSINADVRPKHSYFGVALQVAYNSNPFDMNSYLSFWEQLEQHEGYPFQSISGLSSTNWLQLHIMSGVSYTIPVRKFSFDFKLMAGALCAASPAYSFIVYTDYGNPFGAIANTYTYHSTNAIAPAISISAKAGYAITENLSANMHLEYFYSEPQFVTTGYESRYAYRAYTTVSMINIEAGMAWQFGKMSHKPVAIDSDFILEKDKSKPQLAVLPDTTKKIHSAPSGYIMANVGYSMQVINKDRSPYLLGKPYELGGLMQAGENYAITAGIPIAHSNFGFSAMGFYNYNQFDMQAFFKATNFIFNPATTITSYSAFKEYGLLAGAFITIPAGKFNFDFRSMLGIIYGTSPHFYLDDTSRLYSLAGNKFEFTWARSAMASLAFDEGFDVRYNITKRFTALVNIDYLYAENMSFNAIWVYDLRTLMINYPEPVEYPISLLNFTIGFGYRIGK